MKAQKNLIVFVAFMACLLSAQIGVQNGDINEEEIPLIKETNLIYNNEMNFLASTQFGGGLFYRITLPV